MNTQDPAQSTAEPQGPRTESVLWYLITLALAALVVNENLVQWALAVRVGGYKLGAGFEDAFEFFTFTGYLFATAFRAAPYAALGGLVFVLSESRWRDFVAPVFAGGLVGILAMIVWGLWEAQRPYYTDEHVSSTTAIAFLFIPIFALFTGAAGALLLSLIYLPFRSLLLKRS